MAASELDWQQFPAHRQSPRNHSRSSIRNLRAATESATMPQCHVEVTAQLRRQAAVSNLASPTPAGSKSVHPPAADELRPRPSLPAPRPPQRHSARLSAAFGDAGPPRHQRHRSAGRLRLAMCPPSMPTCIASGFIALRTRPPASHRAASPPISPTGKTSATYTRKDQINIEAPLAPAIATPPHPQSIGRRLLPPLPGPRSAICQVTTLPVDDLFLYLCNSRRARRLVQA